jgi:hypothetical protein
LPVDKAGNYKVNMQLTKAEDYAIVQLYMDGNKLGGPIDLYNENGVVNTGALDMGIHELSEGDHKLTVEIVGSNPDVVKSYLVGRTWSA